MSKQVQARLEEMRKENTILQNSLRDAEIEISRVKENENADLNKFMDQSNRISELERENRSLKTDVDYLK